MLKFVILALQVIKLVLEFVVFALKTFVLRALALILPFKGKVSNLKFTNLVVCIFSLSLLVLELLLEVLDFLFQDLCLSLFLHKFDGQDRDSLIVLLIVFFGMLELLLDVLLPVFHILVLLLVVVDLVSVVVALVLDFLVLVLNMGEFDLPLSFHDSVSVFKISTLVVILRLPLDSEMVVLLDVNVDFSLEFDHLFLVI